MKGIALQEANIFYVLLQRLLLETWSTKSIFRIYFRDRHNVRGIQAELVQAIIRSLN